RLSGPAPNGVRIDNAPAKPSRLTPRFPQKPSWSSRPRVRGAAWVSVIGASVSDRGGPVSFAVVLPDGAVLPDGFADIAGYLSLRRYEPDQVQAVGGPPSAVTTSLPKSRPLSPVSGLPRGPA